MTRKIMKTQEKTWKKNVKKSENGDCTEGIYNYYFNFLKSLLSGIIIIIIIN